MYTLQTEADCTRTWNIEQLPLKIEWIIFMLNFTKRCGSERMMTCHLEKKKTLLATTLLNTRCRTRIVDDLKFAW